MSHEKTLLACITGQTVSLQPTIGGTDVERRLAKASKGYKSPYEGIKVLTLDRNRLQELASHINSPGDAILHRIYVNDNRTGLTVSHSTLISRSLIIVKVEGQRIMMHGIQDGREPWDGDDLDWKNIKEANDYGWNLGTTSI